MITKTFPESMVTKAFFGLVRADDDRREYPPVSAIRLVNGRPNLPLV
jgi:hypothetical protein